MKHRVRDGGRDRAGRAGASRCPAPCRGVGFRPFVHRTATRLGLDGWVRNADGQVIVTAAGSPEALDAFIEQLRGD
ncbi:acylphosphatase, partial [Streptomyces fradiae]|uniref:acylphosphatase n=1 Tax=Streptomyces fradiae TaxID=1906 RepID=UPI00210B88BD